MADEQWCFGHAPFRSADRPNCRVCPSWVRCGERCGVVTPGLPQLPGSPPPLPGMPTNVPYPSQGTLPALPTPPMPQQTYHQPQQQPPQYGYPQQPYAQPRPPMPPPGYQQQWADPMYYTYVQPPPPAQVPPGTAFWHAAGPWLATQIVSAALWGLFILARQWIAGRALEAPKK